MAKKKYNLEPGNSMIEEESGINKEVISLRREEIKKQLSHFLINYRATNRLTQAQMGALLGCSQQQYKRVEDGDEDRIANAISYIDRFAELNGSKSVTEFVAYLTNEPPQMRASNLSKNEQILLSCFSCVDREDRRIFIERYCNGNSSEKFSKIIKILSLIPEVSPHFLDLYIFALLENKSNPDFIDVEEKKNIYNKLREKQKRNFKRDNTLQENLS